MTDAKDPVKAIKIKKNGKVNGGVLGFGSDRHKKLSKSLYENAMWVADDGGGPWKVIFDKSKGSPFAKGSKEDPFIVQKGSYEVSGRPRADADGPYDYSVYDENNNPKDDPDVDIQD